jgi:hypothetical protein
MNKNAWKYLVDTLMFVALLGIVVLGLLLAFVIPRGAAAPEGAKVLLGLHRHYWGDIHLSLSLVFTTLVILHFVLNWEWVKCMARKAFKRAWGPVLALTVLLSFALLAALVLLHPARGSAYGEGGGRGRGRGSGVDDILRPKPEGGSL